MDINIKNPMTHKERAERRDLIAKELTRADKPLPGIAKQHGVSMALVYQIRLSHFSPENRPNTRRTSKGTWSILGDLVKTTGTVDVISKDHGVSKQRVHEILESARNAGVSFPNRKRKKIRCDAKKPNCVKAQDRQDIIIERKTDAEQILKEIEARKNG